MPIVLRAHVRDGGEHPLVETEEEIRDMGAPNAGLAEDIHETKVGEVANEGAAGVREGQGVTPEEPLKADNSYGHHGEPNQ